MRRPGVITVVGARPQFIKMAMLSPLLRKRFDEFIIHTGQHYDFGMSRIFFNELSIPEPDINLNIRSLSQGEQTGRMLIGIENILLKRRPDMVIVYGDTNSTLAGALAAAKLNIPVAHVEAGLRSYNTTMPEENNRMIVDHLSDILLCPTRAAVTNLKKEGIGRGVHLVGDIMYDSLLHFLPAARKRAEILSELGIKVGNYLLLTIHRAENTADLKMLKNILSSIDGLGIPIIFPVHPRTRKFLGNSFKPKKRLIIIPPVSYPQMLFLEENAKAILTDSGGVQKEAYILKVPCVTLRKETEWVETLKGGCNLTVDVRKDDLSAVCRKAINGHPRFRSHLYGNGDTAKRIVRVLSRVFSKRNKK